MNSSTFRLAVLVALVTVSSVLAPCAQAKKISAEDADAILLQVDRHLAPTGSIMFHVSAKDFEKDEFARETRYTTHTNGEGKSLVETTYPDRQKGRKVLSEDHNLWMSTPDIRRPVRISMSQKMTGEVANGDLAKTDFHSDYDADLVAIEELDGTSVRHLNLKAKRSGVTYSHVELWVKASDALPIKASFYAVSGKLLKRGTYKVPKQVLGATVITELTFTDALDTGRRSVVRYADYKRVDYPDSYFSKDRLNE